ncbi:hatching enzyme 1.2-like [Daphnia pulicaria]|uniref:hatching enzyme 1.2-like n=1 Tax=Daphnia pulicaria TaxID=35523 RepID=UPI001EEAB9F7|nr:hatching enzyme 1.2-like [Daphnia pulicaria]
MRHRLRHDAVYHKISCIRFVPRTIQSDYIKINKFDTTDLSCSSTGLGFYKGLEAHHITLSTSCYQYKPGTVIHELMHRIGFAHEHNRPDRDTYVNILWDKIIEKDRRQYAITQGSSLIYRYDYGSVMHYPLGIKMTTKLNTNGAVIGQRDGLSKNDVIKLALMYCLRG